MFLRLALFASVLMFASSCSRARPARPPSDLLADESMRRSEAHSPEQSTTRTFLPAFKDRLVKVNIVGESDMLRWVGTTRQIVEAQLAAAGARVEGSAPEVVEIQISRSYERSPAGSRICIQMNHRLESEGTAFLPGGHFVRRCAGLESTGSVLGGSTGASTDPAYAVFSAVEATVQETAASLKPAERAEFVETYTRTLLQTMDELNRRARPTHVER